MSERKPVRTENESFLEANDNLWNRIHELTVLLREVEWGGEGHGGCCAVCDNHWSNGHKPDCKIASALKEG